MARALYDPIIPPEREVVRELEERVAAARGTRSSTRGPGEQFILSCTCRALEVTSDTAREAAFAAEHALCR